MHVDSICCSSSLVFVTFRRDGAMSKFLLSVAMTRLMLRNVSLLQQVVVCMHFLLRESRKFHESSILVTSCQVNHRCALEMTDYSMLLPLLLLLSCCCTI